MIRTGELQLQLAIFAICLAFSSAYEKTVILNEEKNNTIRANSD